jgi:hypothetical protein
MAEQDLHSYVQIVHAVEPAAVATATVTSAAVDTLGFESIEWVIHVGAAFVGGGYDVTSLEGADDSGFTVNNGAVAAAEILGALPSIIITDTDKVFRVGSIDKRRFQRIVLTETGTITAGVLGITAILSNPKLVPVADQST